MTDKLNQKLKQHGSASAIDCIELLEERIEQLEMSYQTLESQYVRAKSDYLEIQQDRDKLQTAYFNATKKRSNSTTSKSQPNVESLKVPFRAGDSEPKRPSGMFVTNMGVQYWDSGLWFRPCEYSGWEPEDNNQVKWFIDITQLVGAETLTSGVQPRE